MAFRSSMAVGVFCLLASFLLLPFPGKASSDVDSTRNPHSSFSEPSRCGMCHLYEGQKIAAGRFTSASVEICRECHGIEAPGRVHPLLVHPGVKFRDMRVPPDYPLSDDGRIICLTCHNAHGAFRSTAKAYRDQAPVASDRPAGGPLSYKTYFLRRADPSGEGFEALCRGCHKPL